MNLNRYQNGAETVEFAMILPFLLVLVFGIMEYGIYFYDKAVITNATREAARSGIAYKDPKLTTAEIQAVVTHYTTPYLISSQSTTPSVNVNPNPTPTTSGTSISVTVTYPYTFFVFGNLYNFFMNGNITNNKIDISATTIMSNE